MAERAYTVLQLGSWLIAEARWQRDQALVEVDRLHREVEFEARGENPGAGESVGGWWHTHIDPTGARWEHPGRAENCQMPNCRTPADYECRCVVSCADDPATACSLSGEPHVHPDNGTDTFGRCPVHPDAPGDL